LYVLKTAKEKSEEFGFSFVRNLKDQTYSMAMVKHYTEY
jgi:hypothetical protein